MIKDITLGQFFPIDSPIHKLDPRAKILSAIVYIFAIFFVDGYSGYIAVALFTYVIILMSILEQSSLNQHLMLFVIHINSKINLMFS